ncbi:unnamed protein product [Polarella glacialis]|uniref:Uncharacterized protein n=1 Tax=Polarella glacialis TaxID=89957 RepID=A0A813ED83_POLGL|nr:unnamed protein product [Polarella glacialis]
MPQCTVAPILHPGSLHVGPAIPWALRQGDFPKVLKEGETQPPRRSRWNERHQITWPNVEKGPNTRSYFDRHVERVDIPVGPRHRLRPTWSLDVPETESGTQVYRIFDPVTASWKEQTQWAMPEVPCLVSEMSLQPGSANKTTRGGTQTAGKEKPSSPAAQPDLSAAAKNSASRSLMPKTRASDLKSQRFREKEWNKKHAVVFSRNNDGLQSNVRSYFDRWKDDEGGTHEREPSWRLKIERKPLIAKSASEPFLSKFGPQGGAYGQWNPIF